VNKHISAICSALPAYGLKSTTENVSTVLGGNYSFTHFGNDDTGAVDEFWLCVKDLLTKGGGYDDTAPP